MTLLADWPPTPTFASERLLLRPWRREDLDAMAAWPPFADPLDNDFNWPATLQRNGSADLLFWLRSSDPRRREWSIVRHDEVIGYLSIREIDRSARSARLGLGFGAPYVGQGYGSEVLRAFVSRYFGQLGFRALLLEVAAHNTAALRLYERLGFRELRQRWQDAGPAQNWTFLSEPRYDATRRHFELHDSRMLVRMIEMTLTKR